MRVLVVGGGGREHALAWKLAQSPSVDKLFAAPGNAGIAEVAECIDAAGDPGAIAGLAEDLSADLTVIGPEVPLVAGAVDALRARGLAAFGPTADAARIEGSKAYAKEVLAAAGAPTARARSFDDVSAAVEYVDTLAPPYVIKADGLAAGKGVVIARDRAEAVSALEAALVERRFGDAGASVLIEEHLEGEELSIFVLTDGRTVLPLTAAQDFKRALDGDRGPNTGGMGSYSPVPHLPADIVERAMREIFEPVLAEMVRRNVPYTGCLYGGLILTDDGPKVIEFNCRFGDPETQALMPRLDADLAELMRACADGSLEGKEVAWRPEACVSVALTSAGYPGDYETGQPITGLAEAAKLEDVVVFHAGTKPGPVTAGGRVLNVSALGRDLAEARARAYDAIEEIHFEGKTYRRDIALRAADRQGGTQE